MGLMVTIRSLLPKRLGLGRECSLGAALGDEEMLATGAMGYAIETEAVHEYWNNAYGWKIGTVKLVAQLPTNDLLGHAGSGYGCLDMV